MKIPRRIVLLLSIVCIVAFAGTIWADELQVRKPTQSEIGKTVNCPVTNEKFEISKDTAVIDYKGKSYYLCCERCIEDFKKNPEKFTGAGELIVRQPTQSEVGKAATCPVMNSKFEVTQSTPVIDYKGKSYYFCCPSCIEDFKKDPEKFAK